MRKAFFHSYHSERETIREQIQHVAKLVKMKPRIDNSHQRIHSHLFQKSKKKVTENVRHKIIEKDNKILFKKLIKIDSKLAFEQPQTFRRTDSSERRLNSKKIHSENIGHFKRIRAARSQYSLSKYKKDYKMKEYLKYKISENAYRIPRTTDYGKGESVELFHRIPSALRKQRTSR